MGEKGRCKEREKEIERETHRHTYVSHILREAKYSYDDEIDDDKSNSRKQKKLN